MAGPGRPPKPSAVKRAEGNPGKRAVRKDEPKPPPGPLTMPAWLADRPYAVEAWEHYAPLAEGMGVLTTVDVGALAMLCDALAEYRECRDVLISEGSTYKRTTDRGGFAITNRSEVSQGADAWRRAVNMMGQFGLTPSARAKVPGSGAAEVDPFDVFDGPKIADGKQVPA